MDHGGGSEAKAGRDVLAARFEALGGRLTGTAYWLLGHREDARDAVQEAFLRCARAEERVDGVAHVDAWIFAVVLNTAKDLRRRRAVRRAEPLPREETMHPATREAPPDAAIEREDALDRVRSALRSLPEPEREVFLLRQNGELTYEQIAASLHAPVGTIKTRMRTALRRLRAAVDSGRMRRQGAMS